MTNRPTPPKTLELKRSDQRRIMAEWLDWNLDSGWLEAGSPEDPWEEAHRDEHWPEMRILVTEPTTVATQQGKRRGRPPKERHPFDLPPQPQPGRGRPKRSDDERDPILGSTAGDALKILRLWKDEYGKEANGGDVRNQAVSLSIERWARILGITTEELDRRWRNDSIRQRGSIRNIDRNIARSLDAAIHDDLLRARVRQKAFR